MLRIDDTDAGRNVDEALQPILDGFRWLGMDWDEGPDVGGPHEPYYQSQRAEKHKAAAEQLLASGHAYRDYARPEELQTAREAAEKRAAAEASGDDEGPDRLKKFQQQLQDIGKHGGALDQAEERTVGVQGAFNAAAIRGLGAGGPADRTAKAVEAMDKKVAVLVREAQHGGLVFA